MTGAVDDMLDLSGQAAMISGASRGIGRAIAGALAKHGAQVSISARDDGALQATADTLRRLTGARVFALSGDMGDPAFIDEWVGATAREFGRIDVLVNNAGSSPPGDFTTQTDEVWQDAFRVKPFGYIRAARAALPHLKKNCGRIVNIIGLAGHQPLPKFFIGGAGDGALINLTKSLADEVARDGVRVNAVSPGFTRTEQWALLAAGGGAMLGAQPEEAERALLSTMPLGRPADMDEIAAAVLFLASGMSSYITGINLPVDGGATRAA